MGHIFNPNILTVYTGVGSSTTANIQRELTPNYRATVYPRRLAPLVGTSQVLSANSILLILFTVNPAWFAERDHHQLWTLICRCHLTTTTTFYFPHFHLCLLSNGSQCSHPYLWTKSIPTIGITISIRDRNPNDHGVSMVCLTNKRTWCVISHHL